jgi:hypothetical protein
VRKTQRKRAIFSPLVFAQVETLVAQGVSAAQIADKVGCKLGTLRVKCSQRGISLRHRKTPEITPQVRSAKRLIVGISQEIFLKLQQQAEKRGLSRSELAAALLEAIAHDNLYAAVIDRDTRPRSNPALPRVRRSGRT